MSPLLLSNRSSTAWPPPRPPAPGCRPSPGLDHDLEPAGTEPNGATLDTGFLTALHAWAQPYTPAP